MGEKVHSSKRECHVHVQMPGSLDAVACGRFVHSPLPGGAGMGRFVYDRSYRDRPDAVPLDPVHLPLDPTAYETAKLGGIFGVFRDSAPDAWGRFASERVLGTREMTEMDYLLDSPPDRIGALSFGRWAAPVAPARAFNRVIQLAPLREAARLIEAGDLTAEPARELLRQVVDPRTALGGARPKNTVEDDSALWVAKFPARGDRWNNTAVEAAMLTLAARCDIRVPELRIERLGDESILLVRRFDREKVDGGYLRHRMASAFTMLDADDGSADMTTGSYLLLADELERWSSRPRQDRDELFRRIVFNALISNNDDHLRNHAVVAAGREWRLAPAYDLTPNPQAGVQERSLALICGHHGRTACRENLVSAAQRFGLTRDEANAVIDRIREVIEREWRAAVLEQGGTEADCAGIEAAFLHAGFEYPVSPG
jgi:serine/threonine-protein kinase HipA